ncbi:hypothetical protein WN51_13489 [Melipona quadrifasciata]|uniref:Uncharacterized protein n=1 Tax=Melipona quadrifasciata TaxID=166423 RepID=A0A0N0U5F9_9HYME|nr:hypothetical protein WN51_13489 [Melipona quadrifasciata]
METTDCGSKHGAARTTTTCVLADGSKKNDITYGNNTPDTTENTRVLKLSVCMCGMTQHVVVRKSEGQASEKEHLSARRQHAGLE